MGVGTRGRGRWRRVKPERGEKDKGCQSLPPAICIAFAGGAAAMPRRGRADFTAFRDVLTLMTNQPRWDSVQPARLRGGQRRRPNVVQVLGGTSRRKAAAVSITQKFRGVSVALESVLGAGSSALLDFF